MNEEVTYNLLAWGGGYGPKGGETYIYFCEEPPFLVPNGLNIGEQKIYKQGGVFYWWVKYEDRSGIYCVGLGWGYVPWARKH